MANGTTFPGGRTCFFCGVVGLAVTGLIIWITEYYTGVNYRPVRSIAQGFPSPATAPTSSKGLAVSA